jgi:hypothetical protein
VRILGDRIVKLCDNPSLSNFDKITVDKINAIITVNNDLSIILITNFF